jgi:hypothetical protein
MIRRAAAVLLVAVILGVPGPILAASFSPYPDDVSGPTAKKIAVHLRTVQLQVFRHEGDQLTDGTVIGPGTDNDRSGILFRRAEVSVAGRVASPVRYLLVADLSDSDPLIRDAMIDIGTSPVLTLRVGQFRIPFGIETQLPPSNLPFINRMLMTLPGEQPDEIAGVLQEWDGGAEVFGEPISGPLNASYAFARVNGNGLTSVPDASPASDYIGRLGLRLVGYQVGMSWYRGRRQNASFADVSRNRAGWDLEINPNPLKALLIRGELIHGHDGSIAHRSWYLLASYTIADRWTPAMRHERVDPDRSAGADAISRTTLGVSSRLANSTTLSVNYEFRTDDAHAGVGNLAVAQLQVSF